MNDFDITSEYIIIAILACILLILFCINIHISSRCQFTTCCKAEHPNRWESLCVMLTFCAISLFQVALFFIICHILQIISIRTNEPNSESASFLSRVYFLSYSNAQFLIPLLAHFGHLCIMAVFTRRFQLIFTNTMCRDSAISIRFTYTCLCALCLFAAFILFQIVRNDGNKTAILLSQIIWEIAIQCLSLFLLCAFVAKLCKVLHIALSPTANLSSSLLSSTNNSNQNTVEYLNYTLQQTRCQNGGSNSVHHEELEMHGHKDRNRHIIHAMNKMTLLLIVYAMAAVCGLVGFLVIQLYQLQNMNHPGYIMWAYLLLAFDILVASVALYLQFAFTAKIYGKLCRRCEFVLLFLCFKLQHGERSGVKQEEEEESLDLEKQAANDVELNMSSISTGISLPAIVPYKSCTRATATSLAAIPEGDEDEEDGIEIIMNDEIGMCDAVNLQDIVR